MSSLKPGLTLFPSVYLSICLSICLSVCSFVYLSVYLFVCPFVSMYFNSFLLLSVYLCVCLSVCLVGRGGALVEMMTFNQRVVGSTPALAATSGPWASPLPAVACALRRETPIQYPCVVGSSRGLEGAL